MDNNTSTALISWYYLWNKVVEKLDISMLASIRCNFYIFNLYFYMHFDVYVIQYVKL